MRSRATAAVIIAWTFTLAAGSMSGCSCNNNIRHRVGDGGNNGDMGVQLLGTLSIAPNDVTLDLVQGQPPPTQKFTVTLHAMDGDHDISGGCMYSLGDPTLGVMSGSTFTAGTAHGGSTFLTATYAGGAGGGMASQAMATIHVRVKGTFPGPDCMGGGCGNFPPDNAPNCTGISMTPQIFYPPDGILVPPNMGQISVQWKPWAGMPSTIQLFEIDFSNSNTDVRIVTKCSTQLMDTGTPSVATGGCELTLDQSMWDFIAKSNRGGDNVNITVRATTDGTCATKSSNSVAMAIAEQDLNGGVYYWKSNIAMGGFGTGVGGQIWAKQFGNLVPEEQITGVGGLSGTCYGCHSLSRDGKYMTVNQDDDDSDDEYGDTSSGVVDVKAKMPIGGGAGGPPGFQTIAPDDSVYLASDGLNAAPSNVLYLFNVMTGTAATPPSIPVGMANERPTMMDWSADGKTVLYVIPQHTPVWKDTYNRATLYDDDHVFGGSIWKMSYDSTSKTFGTPSVVLASKCNGTGMANTVLCDNNYYPSLSPDGSFIAYNYVAQQTVPAPITGRPECTGTGMQVTCPNDSFSNPKARVFILSTKPGGMPQDLEKANGSPAASPVPYSNSWPRWTPFVQMYKGSKLLWVTFSSTRDYGLRVNNGKAGLFQCYPPDSYEQAGASHATNFPLTCKQPTIWMAAINLSTAEIMTGGDPSYPSFFLPFQALVDTNNNPNHNHTAQWTETVVSQPQPDMGACIGDNQDCTAAPNNCCGGETCTPNGRCGVI